MPPGGVHPITTFQSYGPSRKRLLLCVQQAGENDRYWAQSCHSFFVSGRSDHGSDAIIVGAAIGGLPTAILEGEECDGLADRIAELIRTD